MSLDFRYPPKATIQGLHRPSSTPPGIDAFSDAKTRSVDRSRPRGADIDNNGVVSRFDHREGKPR